MKGVYILLIVIGFILFLLPIYFIIKWVLAFPVLIGENTQINPFTVIYGGNTIVIGRNVMIELSLPGDCM